MSPGWNRLLRFSVRELPHVAGLDDWLQLYGVLVKAKGVYSGERGAVTEDAMALR